MRLTRQTAGVVLGVILAIGFGVLCLWPAWDQSPLYVITNTLTSAIFIAAGLLIYREPDTRTLAKALIIGGILWSAQWLGTWAVGPLPLLAVESNGFFYVVGGWGILSYPDSLKRQRPERRAILGLLLIPVYIAILVISSRPQWNHFPQDVWWPTLVANRTLFSIETKVFYACEIAIAVGFTFALINRLRRMTGIDQIVTKPVAISFGAVGLFSSFSETSELFPTSHIDGYYFTLAFLVLTIPLAILIGAIRRQLQHAAVADSLHRHFAARVATVDVVRDALRQTLNDPSLDILYWSPERSSYLDETGNVTQYPGQTTRHWEREIRTQDGLPLAVFLGDLSHERHQQVVETAINASTMALENARLHTNIQSRLDDVTESRNRITEATLAERRRLERDLHDGVQQRLLALGTKLGIVRRMTSDEQAKDAIEGLAKELQMTMQEFRNVVHGIHPTELRQFGLQDAICVVAEGLPIEVHVNIVDRRFAEDIELTAYFVICELLTNASKHSGSKNAVVYGFLKDGLLNIEVSDNGNGQADLENGTGLIGLCDRLASHHGKLEVDAKTNSGTTVKVQIPCE